MRSGEKVFEELRVRKAAIHRLLVNANRLATALRGIESYSASSGSCTSIR